MKQTPFWVDDHPRPEGLTSELPAETDYLIVGSGLTGLSTALRLAEAGKQVTVIDAAEIAGGASSINGGMVSPDVKAGVDTVYGIYGPKIGYEMWASTVRSVELVRELATRPGIDALIHDAGMTALGYGAKSLKKFDATVAWYREKFGVDWRVLDARDIGSVVGGAAFNVGLFEPEGFGIHPARLSFGLAGEVSRRGVALVDNCAATAMERTGAGLRVETTRGPISAGEVVLATNGYTTPQPSKELARLVVPIGSYIIVTEPLGSERAGRIFPSGSMTYTKKRLLHYMRRTHDDRILLGGRRSLHPHLDLVESGADLRAALVRYFPELADVAITHVWGGRLGVPFDLIPHIGRIDGAWYAMGYAGHGVGLACQLGYELAGMLLGEDPPSVYSLIPHSGRIYYSGKRAWFLTPASYLYRSLDKVGM
ncbi:MAG TPA: FAD-binding oxidoreductase [Acidimicrobiia bacterium]|nr:FAD-binding oxidoreductase [Acidimicrobiia bacterium]